jgi:hypothetical protein
LSLLFAVIIAAIRQKLHLSRCPDLPSQLCRRSGRSFDTTTEFESNRDVSRGLKANGNSASAKSAPTIGKIHRIGSIQ